MSARPMRRLYIALVVGTGLGVVLLLLVLRQMDTGAVWQALMGIEPRRMLVVLAVTVLIQFTRPWRWWLMFPRDERPGFITCFGVLAIANMVNFLVPAVRGGELLRWLLISHRRAAPRRSTALATLGVEKLLDLVAVLAIVDVALLGASVPAWLTATAATVNVLLLVALVAFALLRTRPSWVSGMIHWATLLIPLQRLRAAVRRAANALSGALHTLTSRHMLIGMSAMTVVVWAGQTVLVQLLAWATRTPLSFLDSLMVVGIVSLGTLVPSAPGFIGTWEFFSVAALQLAGVELQAAIALSLVIHGWQFVVAMARGLIWMAISGFSMSQLREDLRQVEAIKP